MLAASLVKPGTRHDGARAMAAKTVAALDAQLQPASWRLRPSFPGP